MNTHISDTDGNAMRARLITPEDQPVFPCWLWHRGNHLMPAQWQHSSQLIQSLAISPYTTHWHPDSLVAPEPLIRAALSPGNATPVGATKAPQGLREAVRDSINKTIIRHESEHNWSVPQSAILVESLLAALAPYVTAQAGAETDPGLAYFAAMVPAPSPNRGTFPPDEIYQPSIATGGAATSPAREEGPTPWTDSVTFLAVPELANGEKEECVSAADAKTLERDLTTARQQLAEARAEGERAKLAAVGAIEAASKYAAVGMYEESDMVKQDFAGTGTVKEFEALRTRANHSLALAGALEDLLFAHENADETGYVDGVGFMRGYDQLPSRARAAIESFRSSTPAPAPAPDKLKKETNL